MVVEWKSEDFSSAAEKFSLHAWRSIIKERKILLWARHYIREEVEPSQSVCGGTDSMMLLEHEAFHMVNFAKNSKNLKGTFGACLLAPRGILELFQHRSRQWVGKQM